VIMCSYNVGLFPAITENRHQLFLN